MEASVGTSFGKGWGQVRPKQCRKGAEGPEMVGLGRTVKDDATRFILFIYFEPPEVLKFVDPSTGGFYVLGYFAPEVFMFSNGRSFCLYFGTRSGRGRAWKGRLVGTGPRGCHCWSQKTGAIAWKSKVSRLP